MIEPGWVSVLPPVVAILLSIWTKQVVWSLFAGIWMGCTVLVGYQPIAGVGASLDVIVHVFSDAGDARVLIFTLLIGAMISTIEFSGGVRGFVRFLESRHWVHTPGRAQWLAWWIGIVIFIESNITLLVAGAVSRPLFDRYQIAREKLAYIIDSTSAPVCVLVPLNAWGALIIGLVASMDVESPLELFIQSIPFNLYAWAALLLTAWVIFRRWDLPAMASAQARTESGLLTWAADPGESAAPESVIAREDPPISDEKARHMLIPILSLLLVMPLGLWITGEGDLLKGSGSTAILWAVISALVSSWLLLLVEGRANMSVLTSVFMTGAGKMLPIAMILLLALALGDVAKTLGTGVYVSGLASATVPTMLLAPMVFLVSAIIAFSVGSSWGTFAIMIPIAIPIALNLELSLPLFLAAAVSGGIFGDHASPISDTTVVASLASQTDHIDHVKTQLPYALLAGAIATVGFWMLSLIL
jgi:tetracycline resistance efflux pump